MLKFHCIYCHQKSKVIRLPLSPTDRDYLRGFQLMHDDICGPKATGGIFETDDENEAEAFAKELARHD